jgi:hypothetical protein
MKASAKGGYKSYKLMSKTDPTIAAGKAAKRATAAKKGAEGPKRSVKGPVKGKAGGRGVAMNKPTKSGK